MNESIKLNIATRINSDHINYCCSRAMNPCKMGRAFKAKEEQHINELLPRIDDYIVSLKKFETVKDFNQHGNHMSKDTFDYIKQNI